MSRLLQSLSVTTICSILWVRRRSSFLLSLTLVDTCEKNEMLLKVLCVLPYWWYHTASSLRLEHRWHSSQQREVRDSDDSIMMLSIKSLTSGFAWEALPHWQWDWDSFPRQFSANTVPLRPDIQITHHGRSWWHELNKYGFRHASRVSSWWTLNTHQTT